MIHCSVMSVSANENRYPIPETFISHPNLEYLYLEAEDEGANLFFSHVQLPSLKQLTLDWDMSRINIGNFTSLLERSSPPLQDLTVVEPDIDEEDLFQLLKAVPTITTLSLTLGLAWGFLPDDLFQILADSSLISPDEGHQNFLPKLEVFKYIGYPNYPWALLPNLFGPISELRHPCRRPLSTLQIHCLTSEEDELLFITDRDVVSQIQDFMDKGMKVEIKDVGCLDCDRDILGPSIELHK